MFSAPNMLILGAAGRNVGKTEFACALIRQLAPVTPVVGVKITTVRERGGPCPRGGRGCGVCSALEGSYCLTEETTADNDKDTARMKAAGARRVLWLRVLKENLEDGIRDLLTQLPTDTPVICESNSARTMISPGAFLVIREAGTTEIKESCAAVLPAADRIIEYHDRSWDFTPERCAFADGRWTVPAAATAAVLAGGKSRRMGRDKSLLPYHGRPLVEHIVGQVSPLVEEVLIGANDTAKYKFLGLPVIPDERPDQGPLMGLLSCLAAARYERVLVTACDIPELPLAFLQRLLQLANSADIVMPRNAEGQHEPLLAVYRRSLAPAARAILQRGGRRLIELFEVPGVRVHFEDLPPGDWYRNLNTMAEYEDALAKTVSP